MLEELDWFRWQDAACSMAAQRNKVRTGCTSRTQLQIFHFLQRRFSSCPAPLQQIRPGLEEEQDDVYPHISVRFLRNASFLWPQEVTHEPACNARAAPPSRLDVRPRRGCRSEQDPTPQEEGGCAVPSLRLNYAWQPVLSEGGAAVMEGGREDLHSHLH